MIYYEIFYGMIMIDDDDNENENDKNGYNSVKFQARTTRLYKGIDLDNAHS